MAQTAKIKIQLIAGLLVIASIFVILNPMANLDILVILAVLTIVLHIFLKEKTILVFLLLRPTVDIWRDYTIFHYQDIAINLNATLTLVLLLWCFLMLIKYRQKIFLLPMKFIVLPLLTLMFASILYSVSPSATLIESTKFLTLVLLLFLSYLFIKEKIITPRQLLSTIALSAVIPLLFGLWQFISQTGIATLDIRGRIYGTFGHPNVLAFYILFLLFLFIQYSTINPTDFWKKNKPLRAITYLVLTVLMLATSTRAAAIGLVVFLIIIGFFKFRKMLMILAGIFAIGYLILFPFNNWLIDKTNTSLQEIPIIERFTTRDEDADSIAWRQTLLRESLPIIYARPWLGFGYGTFPTVWQLNRNISHIWEEGAEAHNDYLRFGLELGIIGLTLYILFILRLIHISVQSLLDKKSNLKNKYLYFFAWVIVFALLSISDNMLHHTPVMWFTFSWWGALLASKHTNHPSPNLL